VDALKEVLLRFSALVEDLPEIDQIEVNPLLVFDQGRGCAALDARVLVKTPPEAL
jgi:acetyltransferase